MTAKPLNLTGDRQHSVKQAIPNEKKIAILCDFSALHPSGIIGMCLMVTYFSRILTDLYSVCETDRNT